MYHLFDVKTTTSMYVINVVFFSFLTTGTRRSIKVLRRIESARALLSKEHSYYRTTTTTTRMLRRQKRRPTTTTPMSMTSIVFYEYE